MTEFKPNPQLNRMVAERVARIMQRAMDEAGVKAARAEAPRLKVWITVKDKDVRPEHAELHGVGLPENLPFVVRSPPYDRQHYGAPEFQSMVGPRDRDATPGLKENCRCQVAYLDSIAPTVKALRVRVEGTTVRGAITIKGPRLRDSEFGTGNATALRFMGRALTKIKRWIEDRF